jgi:hypothetical protein
VELLAKFKSAMRPYKLMARSSTVNNAFAQALAPVDEFDAKRLETAFRKMGLINENGLVCTYCGRRAGSVDHLNPLVKDSKFTGWGHVFGNLVPACSDCNQSKGGKPWREFVRESGLSETLIGQLESYEKQAPSPVSQDDLAEFYPDLIDAYNRLRALNVDTLKTAQSLANEIRRLEAKRKAK